MIQLTTVIFFKWVDTNHRFLDSTVWTPESKPKAKRTQQTTFLVLKPIRTVDGQNPKQPPGMVKTL